MMDLKDILS